MGRWRAWAVLGGYTPTAPPPHLMRWMVAAAFCRFLTARMTLAPRLASSWATVSPRPLVLPVTTAARPVRSPGMLTDERRGQNEEQGAGDEGE